jgi:hypothetical protein
MKSTSTPGPFHEKHLNPRPLLLKEKGREGSYTFGEI